MTRHARSNLDRYALGVALVAGVVIVAWSPIEASPTVYLAGAVGLVAIHERLRAEFPRSAALLTVLAIFAGTTLFWSMTRASSFAEMTAFSLASALLYLSDRVSKGRVVVWGMVAVSPLLFQWLENGTSRPLESTVGSAASIDLFSSTHGFLSLSPLAYLALLGVLLSVRRDAIRVMATLLVLAIWVASSSLLSARTPIAGPAAHHLTPALALLAPGLAYLFDWMRKHPLAAVAPVVVVALAWNYWLMVQYTVGTIPKDAPVSFADLVRQQADVHTGPPYVYPFAFPANVWFASRQGVPVDRFELLAGVPKGDVIDLVFDRRADRFVLEGWEARAADDRESVRWIGERRASAVVPLALASSRPVSMTMTLRARLDDPPVNADLALEVNGQEVGRFSVPSDVPTDVRVTVPRESVGRIFRAGYNRLTFVSYGMHGSRVTDQHSPLPVIHRENRAWPIAVYRIRIAPE